jgi:hypothetical protein
MITNIDLKGTAMPAPIVAEVGQSPTPFEFEIAHHVPGRLRLRSAALKGNACASEQVRRHLAQIDGVTSARANPATGSVLLEYDPNVISPSNVGDVLATRGYALGTTEAETKAGPGWADKLANAARDWAINALAERLALAMISALA